MNKFGHAKQLPSVLRLCAIAIAESTVHSGTSLSLYKDTPELRTPL